MTVGNRSNILKNGGGHDPRQAPPHTMHLSDVWHMRSHTSAACVTDVVCVPGAPIHDTATHLQTSTFPVGEITKSVRMFDGIRKKIDGLLKIPAYFVAFSKEKPPCFVQRVYISLVIQAVN